MDADRGRPVFLCPANACHRAAASGAYKAGASGAVEHDQAALLVVPTRKRRWHAVRSAVAAFSRGR